jgi:hypothetical protein
VGAKLAERRARVTEMDGVRARAQAPTLGAEREEFDLVAVESEPRAQPPPAVATPAPVGGAASRSATESATSEYVHVPRDTVTETQPATAPASAQSVPVAAPLDAEPTRTDTTSVSSAKVLVPPSAPWMTPRKILVGSLAPVLLAVVLAFWFSRSRPDPEGEVVATAGPSAVSDPSGAGTAPDNAPPGPSATAATTGSAPASTGSPSVATRRSQLSVRANASMVSVRVGNRPVEPAHPGREILVDLATDEGTRPLRIEATSADGRHAAATLPPGEASVQLSFAAAPTVPRPTAPPPPPRATPPKPAVAGGPPPLAPIPYGQGR